MSQGRCLLQVRRGALTNIFRSSLQSSHICGNFSVQMCVLFKNFQVKSTTCHRITPTFKPNWFHPVTSLNQDGRSQIFCCPQGQLVQPCAWKAEIRSKQPESRIISWKYKQENKSCWNLSCGAWGWAALQHYSEQLPLACLAEELRAFRKKKNLEPPCIESIFVLKPYSSQFFLLEGKKRPSGLTDKLK